MGRPSPMALARVMDSSKDSSASARPSSRHCQRAWELVMLRAKAAPGDEPQPFGQADAAQILAPNPVNSPLLQGEKSGLHPVPPCKRAPGQLDDQSVFPRFHSGKVENFLNRQNHCLQLGEKPGNETAGLLQLPGGLKRL